MEGDGGQATATIKGFVANAGDRIRNGDRGQAAAAIESMIAD